MKRSAILFAVLLVLSLAGAALVSSRVDELRAGAGLQDVLYVSSPKSLKRMSLGYSGLLADIYWTRAVQYFGSRHFAHSTEYDLLAPLLDITTELDPHLLVAYQFGSIFLSQRPPEGAGQPDKAVQLVSRGIRSNPNEWRLYYNLGWIEYDRKAYGAASRAFAQGAKVPGAPPAMGVMAATTAHHGGEIATARFLWIQILNTSTDKLIRATAIKRLQSLQVDEDIPYLEKVIQAYRNLTGHYPASWSELEATGWQGHTADPLGQQYVLKGDRVEVQDPDRWPFITRGLPSGWKTSSMIPEEPQATGRAESPGQ